MRLIGAELFDRAASASLDLIGFSQLGGGLALIRARRSCFRFVKKIRPKLHLYSKYSFKLFLSLLVTKVGTNNERYIFGLPLKSKKYIRRVLTFLRLCFNM